MTSKTRSGAAAPTGAGEEIDMKQASSSTTTSTTKKASSTTTKAAPKRSFNMCDVMMSTAFLLVAVVAIIAGKYPAQMEAMVQTIRGSIQQSNAAAEVATGAKKPFSRIVVDPRPNHRITEPTARLLGEKALSEDEIKKAPFRPHVLTDSINPPVTPVHGAGEIGLFLYQNGFSENPVNAIVSRESLCRSPDTISKVLTSEVDADWNCASGADGSCRIFLHNGWEITTCAELTENDKLWLVPRGREFIWPTFKKGHLVEVRHVTTANNKPIIVETLSESPKVFRLNNFFTEEEADELIENALNLNDPVNGLHRSTTGQGDAAQEDSHRTSDNAWDLVSPASMRLKRRIFDLLGVRPYNNAWADGLQILRYNMTQAYNTHFDYLEYTPGSRLDSSRPGGVNRFATVVIYLTDVEEGGETVFPEGKALDGSDKSHDEVMAELKEKGMDLKDIGISPGSWQERLVVQCRSKLAVKPVKAHAVLFYDQLPMGGQDDASLHGGCPVLKGVKWAANLWVWQGPVHGNDFVPAGSKDEVHDNGEMQVEFVSSVPGYSLYWQDTFFATLEQGVNVRMNTFQGHEFNIFEGRTEAEKGQKMRTFVMQPKGQFSKSARIYRFDGPNTAEEINEGEFFEETGFDHDEDFFEGEEDEEDDFDEEDDEEDEWWGDEAEDMDDETVEVVFTAEGENDEF